MVSSGTDLFLGIEGGGTKTIAIVADASGGMHAGLELGSGNVRLLSDQQLIELLKPVARACPTPVGIGIGMAGARDEADRVRIRKALQTLWPGVPALVTHDLEIALDAASVDAKAKVLILSGTGSCCYGRAGAKVEKVGGGGHLLGDKGSGYAIAISALREVIYEFDRHGKWGIFGERVIRTLLLNEPNDLIGWIQSASKSEIAALAPVVFGSQGNVLARRVLAQAAESLANDALICAARLARKSERIAFILAGSVLLKQPAFGKKVGRIIRRKMPHVTVAPLEREGAWGAIGLARKALARKQSARPAKVAAGMGPIIYVPNFVPADSPTEQRNASSMQFHEFSNAKMVATMLTAESAVIPAVRHEQKTILRAVTLAAETLKQKGRIFYVGAGTSGRLGVLDASECPPTFRASPEMVQGIMAGGQRALWQAVEGAEDDSEAGARAIEFRKVGPRDLVIGIAASGRTPFVWGALGAARRVGSKTVLICFNPSLQIAKEHRPDVVIAPNLGPEILTGSTRLKSGTATKIILNMISTIAMVRLGKVIGNLMVDLNPSNVKLRDRAVRILCELTECSREAAEAVLKKNGWVVKVAWMELAKQRGKGGKGK